MAGGFNDLLNQLEEGADYRKKPPHGPPDKFPALSQEEVERIQRERDHTEKDRSYAYTEVLEDHFPRNIEYPSADDLDGVQIFAIDGSNQLVGPPAFKAILAKASIVKFEYTRQKKRRYHDIQSRECQAIFIAEGGIFQDTVDLLGENMPTGDKEKEKILDDVKQFDSENPFLLEANEETGNPANEAMGWGVKFQQTLELLNLDYVEDRLGVTIRDGPLLSTSAFEKDTINAMSDYVKHWKQQVLVSVSKNVDNSALIVEALKENKALRDAWFPNQNITREQLDKISSDSSILDKIIEPGQRTPFIEAVNRQRRNLVEEESGLAPVACYYLTRNDPRAFVRLEVPKFMWEGRNYDISKAIKIVTWQHELGGVIPLIQEWAHNTSQLHDEKRLVRDQIKLQLAEKDLNPLGDWEDD